MINNSYKGDFNNYKNLDPKIGNNDVCFADFIHPKYNCFMTWPLVAGQRKSYSDIQKTVMESNNMFLEIVSRRLYKFRKLAHLTLD